MNIKIFYNKEKDEFSADLSLETRIKRYINENFFPAYAISCLAPVYLLGGSVRDLIFARIPKDMDFVVLGKENLDWVLKVLKKFNIEYKFNRFGGFKFTYKGTEIDLWLADDLFSAMQYNVDGLFFDLVSDRLISLTFEDYYKNGLKVVNKENNIENGREAKLVKFTNDYFKE